MNENNNTFTPAGYLSAVFFCGTDAAAFLQGQLSADVAGMSPGCWRRAAYCSPKGRALATMIIVRRTEDEFVALLPESVAGFVVDRLSRFILRAKVRILRPPCAIEARVSDNHDSGLLRGGDVREEDGALYVDEGGGAILRVRLESAAVAGDDSAWRLMQIMRGVPWIDAAVSDRLVPQYFNFDLLGGVDFRKGCYVGQEIVARLHYLGNVRRRGYILRGGGEIPADTATEIVNAVAARDGFFAFVVASRETEKNMRGEDGERELREPPYGLPTAEEDQKPKPKVGG